MSKQYKMPKWAVSQVTRTSGLVEDTCQHGISHPNKEWLAKHDSDGKKGFAIHGCDGCCVPDNKSIKTNDTYRLVEVSKTIDNETLEPSEEMIKAIERAKQRIQRGQSVNEKEAREKLGLRKVDKLGESLFLNLFGNSELMQIMDFLIENQVLNLRYSIGEIADSLDEHPIGVESGINDLRGLGLVLRTDNKVELNTSNEVVERLIEIDNILTRQGANKLEKKLV